MTTPPDALILALEQTHTGHEGSKLGVVTAVVNSSTFYGHYGSKLPDRLNMLKGFLSSGISSVVHYSNDSGFRPLLLQRIEDIPPCSQLRV